MMRMLAGIVCLLTACQGVKIEPVDITGDDMCSFCRMAISQKRFAVEFWSKAPSLFKFDDAACMMSYLKRENQRQNVLATFVMDYEELRWLKAEEAYFIQSTQLKTPMRGGIIAFADKRHAEMAASRYQGKILKFDELCQLVGPD